MNKESILETLKVQPLTEEEKQARHILKRLTGPIATCSEETRNGRRYSRELWEKALNDEIFKEKIDNKGLFLELGHPEGREEIDMSLACAVIPEMPKIVGDDLYAVVDVIDTPNGRLLNTLIDYGFTPGISSRGSGDVIDDEVDPETFFLETWDIVNTPSVKKARLSVTESIEHQKSMKTALVESLNKASDEDKKLMKEALNNLHIDVEDEPEQKECNSENCTDKLTEDLSVQSTEASNAGTEELVNSMTKLLQEKVELENANRELQEKLAVSDSKVNKLTETLSRSRSSIVRLTAIAQDSKKNSDELSTLKEELESKNARIESLEKELETSKSQSLTESVKLKDLSSAKTKTIKELTESIEKQKQGYETELKSLKEDFEKKSSESSKLIEDLNKKVTDTKQLSEAYKTKANEFLNEYINLKAKLVGCRPIEIKNKLAKNCSVDDVNKICESIQSYELSIGKMNLNLDKKVKIEFKESVPASMVNSDDMIDESLLTMASRISSK